MDLYAQENCPIESLVVPIPNIEKNINLSVNLNVPIFSVDLLNNDLQKIGLNVNNTEIIGVNRTKKEDLDLNFSKFNIWGRIRKNIKDLFNRN